MQLRNFILITLVIGALCFGALKSRAQSSDESLNNELNAAEGAADDEGQPSGKPLVQGDLVPETPEPVIKPPPQTAPLEKTPPPPKVSSETTVPEDSPEVTSEPSQDTSPQALDEEPPAPAIDEVPPPDEEKKSSVQAVTSDTKTCNCRAKAGIPYRDRRSAISGFFGFEGGTYAPTNYTPQIVGGQTYGSYYSSATPNVEIVFGAKYNFILGSIGPQISGGFFSATAGDGSTLTVNPITAGIIYSMDSLFKEPYVVPYVVGGYYTDIYKETNAGISVDGQTSYANFYALGVMFQLDWMDEETHDSGYKDFGLENTFIFVEARSFLYSNDVSADFSTPLQVSGGFRFEF